MQPLIFSWLVARAGGWHRRSLLHSAAAILAARRQPGRVASGACRQCELLFGEGPAAAAQHLLLVLCIAGLQRCTLLGRQWGAQAGGGGAQVICQPVLRGQAAPVGGGGPAGVGRAGRPVTAGQSGAAGSAMAQH